MWPSSQRKCAAPGGTLQKVMTQLPRPRQRQAAEDDQKLSSAITFLKPVGSYCHYLYVYIILMSLHELVNSHILTSKQNWNANSIFCIKSSISVDSS